MSTPNTIVLSDLHLNARGERACVPALERLLRRFHGAELIFAGDVFEFSTIAPLSDVRAAWAKVRDANPRFCAALKAHITTGRRITFVCGNHDAPLSSLVEEVRRDLAPYSPELLQICPWLLRRGKTVIEHGHLYDPDNAPLHPLANWRRTTEPMGIALMRRFVAVQGALEFAHAHSITPAQAITRALAHYRHKTPLVAASYFGTATALCYEAAVPRKVQLREDALQGSDRLALLAAEQGITQAALVELLARTPTPTHASSRALFLRLYFDRVVSSLAGTSAGISLLRALPVVAPLPLAVLGGSALYLATSVKQRANRSTNPVRFLAEAAQRIRPLLAADVVIFGHTHVVVDSPHYYNLGSFEYGDQRGRPYLLLDAAGRPTRHYAPYSIS